MYTIFYKSKRDGNGLEYALKRCFGRFCCVYIVKFTKYVARLTKFLKLR